MERPILIIIVIIVTAGLLVLLFGQRPALPPGKVIAAQIEMLEAACVRACGGQDATLSLTLPEGARLYTTAEASCITYGKALFCSRCGCEIVPNTTLVPGNHSCVMRAGETLKLDCTTFINS